MIGKVPLYLCPVVAGFPSPADDFVEQELDLNEHLIKHPAATFFVRVEGNSMLEAGIHPGDILVVDRSLIPKNGEIIIAAVNSELTVKRIQKKDNQVWLTTDNDWFKPIEITEETDFMVWGVVTYVLHKT